MLTSAGNNSHTTFAGEVSGTGGITKSGSGKLSLREVKNISGVTTVNAGTLESIGSAITSKVKVSNGANYAIDLTSPGEAITYSKTISGGGSFLKSGSEH